MKKLTMVMAAAVMLFTAASGEAQDSAKQQKPVRFSCVEGFPVELLVVVLGIQWEECTLLNMVELYQGSRKTLTDNGVWGKATVEFVSEEERDGRILLWFTDDAISREAGYTYKVPFGSSRKAGLKAGQKVIIYYGGDGTGEEIEIQLFGIEVL